MSNQRPDPADAEDSSGETDRGACCAIGDVLEPGLFKALADPTRIGLLAHLAERGTPCTVSEAGAGCPVDLSVVSRHLALLRQAGVVEARKRGRQVHYEVRYAALARMLRAAADAIQACCPPSGGGGPSTRRGRRDRKRGDR